jgi:thiol:disulfide interchange protein DsbC
MKNNKTGIDKTGLTNTLKKAFETNKRSKLFVAVSFLLFLVVLLFSEKPAAQMVNQENLSVHQEALAVNQETLAVNQETLALNKESLSVNQEALAVNQEALAVNKESLSVNKAVQAVNQDVQNLIKKQFKATFKQITFTNLEPAPINNWYQAEVGNQVVYFSPTQALMFLGEVYTNNGISLSAQTRKKWQSRRVANLNLSAALVIGTGAIEIIEFTDTDCTFCQRFNRWITAKNEAYKDKHNQDLVTRKIVLTPIDQLHPNAHKEAIHILCQSPENYETALTQTLESKLSFAEMDSCQKGKALLKKHRKIAQALGVSATPILVINGQIIQGFNQQKLEAVIKQQLNKKAEVRQINEYEHD